MWNQRKYFHKENIHHNKYKSNKQTNKPKWCCPKIHLNDFTVGQTDSWKISMSTTPLDVFESWAHDMTIPIKQNKQLNYYDEKKRTLPS